MTGATAGPSTDLVMLDRARLRHLAGRLSHARHDLGRVGAEAEALLEQAVAAIDVDRSTPLESIDRVADWCRWQEADLERRLTVFVAGDDIDRRSAHLPPLDRASAYDGRRVGRLLRDMLAGNDPPSLGELRTVMPLVAANSDDLHFVGAMWNELGAARTKELATTIIAAHAEAAGSAFDPRRPETLGKPAFEAAMEDLRPVHEALAFALDRAGSPEGLDRAFLDAFSSGPGATEGIDAGLLARCEEALVGFEDELTAAGLTLSVVEDTTRGLTDGGRLAAKPLTTRSLVVLKHGGRAVGWVSILALLTHMDEGDAGDKVAVGAEIGLSLVSMFGPTPVAWAATATLLLIWLFSKSKDLPPAIDGGMYYDDDHPKGTRRSGGLTPYMGPSGAPVPSP